MALGTYPEPHSRIPGAPYVREPLPTVDLNQIVDNQRTLWGGVVAVTGELKGSHKVVANLHSSSVSSINFSTTSSGLINLTDSGSHAVADAVADLIPGDIVKGQAYFQASLSAGCTLYISAQTLENTVHVGTASPYQHYAGAANPLIVLPIYYVMTTSGLFAIQAQAWISGTGSVINANYNDNSYMDLMVLRPTP